MAETDLFKWRHYGSEVILPCVPWYLRYALSFSIFVSQHIFCSTTRKILIDFSKLNRLVFPSSNNQ